MIQHDPETATIQLLAKEKELRLRTLKPFVLDNSIRESTVVSLRGHTKADKTVILEAISKTGISDIIIGTFGQHTRVDDEFALDLQESGTDMSRFYVFSDAVEPAHDDEHKNDKKLHPHTDFDSRELPLGLRKCLQYGVPNIIFVDMFCAFADEYRFNASAVAARFDFLIQYVC